MNVLGNIEFGNVWAFFLLPFILYGFYYVYQAEKRRPVFLRFSNISDTNTYSNWKTQLSYLPEIFKLLALIMLVVGLARPRKALVNESVKGRGIDIVIALDVSMSMLTQDFNPNRLEVSKKLAIEFVKKRISDRIGLVVFSGESFTQCPLTIDHDILNEFIASQNVGYLQDGTAIGMGLATAVNRMKESKSRSKVIILLTDGVNNSGYIDPATASSLAKEGGIKVYCIGIGSNEMALGPVGRSVTGELVMNYIKSEIDEKLLTTIATETGGKYFRAMTIDELAQIYGTIDKLEKTEIELAVLKKYKELYRIPLIIASLFLILGIILQNSIFRKFPL